MAIVFDVNVRLLANMGSFWRRCVIAGVVFFAALTIAIVVDAWIHDRAGTTGTDPLGPIVAQRVVHVRYYVLPWAGFLISAFLVLRYGVRAGNNAVRILADGGSAWVA